MSTSNPLPTATRSPSPSDAPSYSVTELSPVSSLHPIAPTLPVPTVTAYCPPLYGEGCVVEGQALAAGMLLGGVNAVAQRFRIALMRFDPDAARGIITTRYAADVLDPEGRAAYRTPLVANAHLARRLAELRIAACVDGCLSHLAHLAHERMERESETPHRCPCALCRWPRLSRPAASPR